MELVRNRLDRAASEMDVLPRQCFYRRLPDQQTPGGEVKLGGTHTISKLSGLAGDLPAKMPEQN